MKHRTESPSQKPLCASSLRVSLRVRSTLTENLLQLHDGGVGPDAVHRLGLLGSLLILEDLFERVGTLVLERVGGLVLGHVDNRFPDEIGDQWLSKGLLSGCRGF